MYDLSSMEKCRICGSEPSWGGVVPLRTFFKCSKRKCKNRFAAVYERKCLDKYIFQYTPEELKLKEDELKTFNEPRENKAIDEWNDYNKKE